MKLLEIEENVYLNFLNAYKYKNFLSTPNIGHFKEEQGNEVYYLGMYDNNILVSACMLIMKKNKEFYAIRGPLTNYSNYELLNTFISLLKDFSKKKGGFVLKIDPYIMHHERNNDGDIVPNGVDNENMVSNIEKIGFKKVKYEDSVQASWIYTLDIRNRTLEDIMSKMDSKTRQMIRKNEKNGIIIREGNENDLELFTDIYKDAGERKNFNTHVLDYYKSFYKHSKENIKLIFAELDTNIMIENIKKEIETNKEEIYLCEKQKAKMNIQKYEQKIGMANKEIARLNENIKKAIDLEKEFGPIITLGAILYFIYGNEVLSLSGGTYSKYMKWQPFYTINYEMLKYAIDNNYDVYNFYGISNNLTKEDKQYGVYEFKKGFGGNVVELIGEFELPLSFKYYLYKIKDCLRKLVK